MLPLWRCWKVALMRGKAGKYEERFEVVREYYTVLLTGPTRGRESIKIKKNECLTRHTLSELWY